MENEDSIQNTKFNDLKDFLNLKFETLGKDVARTDGKLTLMEQKNCRKHQEILETTNKYRGEISNELVNFRKEIKDCYVTKDEVAPVLGIYAKMNNWSFAIILFLIGVVASGLLAVRDLLKK